MTNDRNRSAADELAMSDEDVLALVRSGANRFGRQLRWRDRGEVIACIVVAAVMIPAAFRGPWLARTGAIVILAGLVLVAFRLWHAQWLGGRGATDPSLAVADALRAELRRVNVQISLLESVAWWYVTPLAAGAVLLVAGSHPAAWFIAAYVLATVLIAWLVIALNMRAVRRDLRPKRDEITALLAQLES